jgi:hypothetical protein
MTDIARLQPRREHLLDIGAEDVAVHGAIDDQNGVVRPLVLKLATKVEVFQCPCGRCNQPLSTRCAPVPRIGGCPGLVDEGQPVGV